MLKEERELRKMVRKDDKVCLKAIRALVRAVRAEERERCAKVADKNCIEYEHLEPLSMERSWNRCSTAAAIRRGR